MTSRNKVLKNESFFEKKKSGIKDTDSIKEIYMYTLFSNQNPKVSSKYVEIKCQLDATEVFIAASCKPDT